MTAGGTIAVIIGLYWAARKVRRIRSVCRKRIVFAIKAARMSRLICCLILIGACIYGRTLIVSHYAVSYSDVAYSISETHNDIADYENSLAANIATVAKIDSEGG